MNNLFYCNKNCPPCPPPPPPPKTPVPPKPSKPPISPKPPAPQKKPPKKNIDFKKLKKNTCKSLNEVECFLNDFKRFSNYIKLYKILK